MMLGGIPNTTCKVILIRVFDIAPELNGKLNVKKKHGKLDTIEIKIIKELILILERFEDASDVFQADFLNCEKFDPCLLRLG
jgi:hypothetical protein